MTRSVQRLRRLESLRHIEEQGARYALVASVAAVQTAMGSVPATPDPLPMGILDPESLRCGIAKERLGWALVGAGLGRIDVARESEVQARSVWSGAAVALRAVQRLADRSDARQRAKTAKREQRDLDEVAIVAWRGRHG